MKNPQSAFQKQIQKIHKESLNQEAWPGKAFLTLVDSLTDQIIAWDNLSKYKIFADTLNAKLQGKFKGFHAQYSETKMAPNVTTKEVVAIFAAQFKLSTVRVPQEKI